MTLSALTLPVKCDNYYLVFILTIIAEVESKTENNSLISCVTFLVVDTISDSKWIFVIGDDLLNGFYFAYWKKATLYRLRRIIAVNKRFVSNNTKCNWVVRVVEWTCFHATKRKRNTKAQRHVGIPNKLCPFYHLLSTNTVRRWIAWGDRSQSIVISRKCTLKNHSLSPNNSTSTDKAWALIDKKRHMTHMWSWLIHTVVDVFFFFGGETNEMSDKKRQQQYCRARFDFRSGQYTPTFLDKLIGCAIFRCRCFVRSNLSALACVSVSLLMSCVRCCYALSRNLQPSTNAVVFFVFFHLFILCSRQRSTRDCTKMPVFDCRPYEIVVFCCCFFLFFSSLCVFSFTSSLDKCVRNVYSIFRMYSLTRYSTFSLVYCISCIHSQLDKCQQNKCHSRQSENGTKRVA